MSEQSYDGRQDGIRALKTPAIEVFENVYNDKDYEIKLEIDEFTAVCPKTGLPDFGTIYITYVPDKVCIELKSLKEYLLFYRNVGIFHENVVNKVLEDLVACSSARKLEVVAVYKVRGGIKTTVSRSYEAG